MSPLMIHLDLKEIFCFLDIFKIRILHYRFT